MRRAQAAASSARRQVETRPGTRPGTRRRCAAPSSEQRLCGFIPLGSCSLGTTQERSNRHVYCRASISDRIASLPERTRTRTVASPMPKRRSSCWNSSTRAMPSYLHTCEVGHVRGPADRRPFQPRLMKHHLSHLISPEPCTHPVTGPLRSLASASPITDKSSV